MKCYYCGNELPMGAKFCGECGRSQSIGSDLLEAAKNGNQEAFAQLYERTYNQVYFAVKALIRNEDTVQDIMQDTYLQAYLKMETLTDAEKFPAWICTVARNRALDYLKKKKEILFSEMENEDGGITFEAEETDTENLPEIKMDQKETTRLIREILQEIPEDQRLVAVLYYEDQYTIREIAESLGISENTVKSRLSYARKKVEKGVRRLEKQGISLRGLAPIPFLLALLRAQKAQATAKPDGKMLQDIQNAIAQMDKAAEGAAERGISESKVNDNPATAASDESTADTATAVSEESAADTVTAADGGNAVAMTAKIGSSAGKGLAAKIMAVVVAVSLLGGVAVYCLSAKSGNSAGKEENTVITVTESESGTEIQAETETKTETESETESENVAESASKNEKYSSTRTNMLTEEYINIANEPAACVWKSEILRSSIKTLTFLDSLESVGENAWDVSIDGDGSVLAWTTDAGDGYYNLYVAADGAVIAPGDTEFLYAFSELTSVSFGNNFDTSGVKSMNDWFHGCYMLEELDLSSFDTSSVTTMCEMFCDCHSLKYINLESFDTSQVWNMTGMFDGCQALENLDLSTFDTSNVLDFGAMFWNCWSLKELDLSGFDTSMSGGFISMFENCYSLESVDLSSFDTSSANDFSAMFRECYSLTTLDLSSFDTSKAAYMACMFAGCSSLQELDISNFDMSNVTDTTDMFLGTIWE